MDQTTVGDVMSRVSDQDFTNARYRLIFQAIRRLYASAQLVDGFTVNEALGGNYNQILADIINTLTTSANCGVYVDLLKKSATLYHLRDLGEQLAGAPDDAAAQVLVEDINRLCCDKPGIRITSLADCYNEFLDRKGDGKKPDYLTWGIPALDERIYVEGGDMGKRITWKTPDGHWGIDGVDLAALPPRVYGALYKLKNLEDLVETVQDPFAPEYEITLAKEELLGVPHGEFQELGELLLRSFLYTELDRDVLGQYLVTRERWAKADKLAAAGIRAKDEELAKSWSGIQASYFKQCRQCAEAMIHLPSTMTEGDRYDHFDSIAVLDSITESCVNAYLLRSSGKLTRDEIREKMTATTWMPAQDAIAAGLADHIIGDNGEGIDLNRIVAAAGGLPDIQKLRAQYLATHPEGVPQASSEPQPGADPPGLPSDPAGAEPAKNTVQAAMDRLAIEKARYGGF